VAASCLAAALSSAQQSNGLLLVADPQLDNSVFQRSVVLVVPHGRGAALGVILNHPIPVEAARLFPQEDVLRKAGKIHYGGPVNPSALVFLFRAQQEPPNALRILEEVYMSNDRELLARQLRRPRHESGLQVYAGYAGWAPGQLQMEIMHGSWTTVEADNDLLFNRDRTSLWDTLVKRQSGNWI